MSVAIGVRIMNSQNTCDPKTTVALYVIMQTLDVLLEHVKFVARKTFAVTAEKSVIMANGFVKIVLLIMVVTNATTVFVDIYKIHF